MRISMGFFSEIFGGHLIGKREPAPARSWFPPGFRFSPPLLFCRKFFARSFVYEKSGKVGSSYPMTGQPDLHPKKNRDIMYP
jgi:hypothetical protein